MSTLTLSNYAVIKWYNSIQKWRATEDIHLAMVNVDYIEKKIAFAARSAMERNNDLVKKYFYLDDKGQVKMEGEKGKEQPCFLPDKTKEGYDEEYKALMTKTDTYKF